MESFKFESVLALQQKRTPSDWISSRVEFFLYFTENCFPVKQKTLCEDAHCGV